MDPAQRLGVLSLLGTLALCSACDRPPAPAAENARYQFTTDKAGNTFKLDTVTGEVTRITPEPTRPTPPRRAVARPQTQTPKTENSRGAVVRGSEEPKTAVPTEVVAERPAVAAAPTTSQADTTPAVSNPATSNGCGPDARRTFLVLIDAEAFVTADASSQRLATIAAGVSVIGVASQGEWRLVRFKDAIWGQRAGYVLCSTLEAVN
jgi:hypothetical protein